MRFVPIAMGTQRRHLAIGFFQLPDRLAGEVGRQPLLPVVMLSFHFAFGLGCRRVTQTHAVEGQRAA